MALGKVQKTCRFRMFLCAICHKKRLAGHVSEYLCKWLGWVYQCEDFTFRFTSSFVQMQIPLINPWYYAISCDFYASTLLVLYLFTTHPCIFFIFHQVVRKPFKFINNGLQTNETLVMKRTSPVFSRYFCIHFRPSLGKVFKQFLYKYQYQCILILIWEFRWW